MCVRDSDEEMCVYKYNMFAYELDACMCVYMCVEERYVCILMLVRMHESEREKQKRSPRALCMCVYVCVSVSVCNRWIDVSVSLYDRATWALAVRVYVSALGRASLSCVCVPLRRLILSLSVSVCVTDWVGGRTPAWAPTTLAPRGPSMWGPGWRSSPS
jgi:hypothetical protein